VQPHRRRHPGARAAAHRLRPDIPGAWRRVIADLATALAILTTAALFAATYYYLHR
jgi:hypothetical protein